MSTTDDRTAPGVDRVVTSTGTTRLTTERWTDGRCLVCPMTFNNTGAAASHRRRRSAS